MKSYISLLLALFFISLCVQAESFTFDSSLQDWGSWGSGTGVHSSKVGHKKSGSMWLSADWGDVQTLHYNWSHLRPGMYRVTAFVRGEDIQPHPDGSSFWHFIDTGKGTENIFLSLDGSYNWRKIQYTVRVPQNQLSMWFRLKAPGQAWVDDLSIEPVTVEEKLSISAAEPLTEVSGPEIASAGAYKEIVLLDFDNIKRSHPFEVITNSQNQKMGKFSSRSYFNFDPSSYLSGNWSEYDRISLDVYNGNKTFLEIYLTLGDSTSTNYWSQLNHKTHIAPGWNHLNFSLTQFLGERGSHRYQRGMNLKDVRKWFLVVDPNERYAKNSNFFIDNIKLTRNPAPLPPAGVLAFDFTSHKDTSISGFKKVTSQNLYNSNRGFGFVEPQYWRVEDSQWASSSLRYSIGLLKGQFRVKLPSGRYRGRIVLDRLGYWDTSFWKDRTFYVNGTPVFKETRSAGMDYLKDWLQFEAIVPQNDDHPYDLYLKRLFKPIEFNAVVKNGFLNLEFEGDATGVSLNNLILWDVSSEKDAKNFLSQVEERNRLEFDWMSRPLAGKENESNDTVEVKLIHPSLVLSPSGNSQSTGKEIFLQGGRGEKLYQLIQLRGQGEATIEISAIRSKEGKSIDSSAWTISEVIPQYISPDLNHETYMVAGKFLRPINGKIELSQDSTRYLWVEMKVPEEVQNSKYQGQLTVSLHKAKYEFPIQVHTFAFDLPHVDFPVGFFGPDPITYTYFESPDIDKIRKKYRHQAIAMLGAAGFTTISGLPEAKLVVEGDQWRLDSSAPDETMTAAIRAGMEKTFFSYGGKFPQQFFDGSLIPSGMNENEFFKKTSKILNGYLTQKGMPKIVHTFSDEAGGYSDRINEDIAFAKKLKTSFPFMLRGGFGSKANQATAPLNAYFDFGFFSNVTRSQMKSMGPKSKWGSYNASPGNLDDPRYTFGPGLYYARHGGLSHYLEWHSSSVNNYPYYDLDGRESDVTMFMPSSDGSLHPTLRFQLAVEGLSSYRKLKLLEQLIGTSKDQAKVAKARDWLNSYKSGKFSAEDNILKPAASFSFTKFNQELNSHLSQILN